jgi:hypothetical protein
MTSIEVEIKASCEILGQLELFDACTPNNQAPAEENPYLPKAACRDLI